jgi:hypothetical protein
MTNAKQSAKMLHRIKRDIYPSMVEGEKACRDEGNTSRCGKIPQVPMLNRGDGKGSGNGPTMYQTSNLQDILFSFSSR